MSKGRRGPRQGNRKKSYSEREHAMGEFKRRYVSSANKERGIRVDEELGESVAEISDLIPKPKLMRREQEYPV